MEIQMKNSSRPVVISSPDPRSLDLIFTSDARKSLQERYDLVECTPEDFATLDAESLRGARYIIGQPEISDQTLAQLQNLRCVLNVEGNLINNMPYEELFGRGIHVVTTSRVFAQPVAEIGLAMALNLARGVIEADLDFRNGRELWGGDGNKSARLLSGSDVGIIGFGDLGRALRQVLSGFNVRIKAYDPWLPPSVLLENGVQPAGLAEVLSTSDFLFVLATVTTENQGYLGAREFQTMRKGAAFILLSRAEVVDFDALMDAVDSGHIIAASDVFPEEPMPRNHRVRNLDGILRSAHRAGALDSAFKNMGDMLLEDMDLMDRGLPPMRCKRAERETFGRMKSKPVTKN